MNPRYAMVVFWSDEDNCWIGDAPDLRSCSAHGESPAAALAELQVAIDLWLYVVRQEGWPMPEPRFHLQLPLAEEAPVPARF